MSADNGIYILKTKDQYRVAHLSAIENITWSFIDGDWDCRFVPTRVVDMWGNCKYTRDANKALRIAYKMVKSLPACEYGVNIITYNKPWKYILEDAKKYAKKEIQYLENNGRSLSCKYSIESLQKILHMDY